ncbi:hypothetical protein GCM10022291_00860 [Postechiella marina]|uniref:histidine kinase n=1 Tax=Postechiella marina TaxID=943941 RepID=A0ABP8BYN7_9FLAO
MNIYITIIAEFLLIASCILLLFKFRNKIGLAPLYILLGAIQYLQANLERSFNLPVFNDYTIYPNSIILFSAVLFATLLIYIREGAASSRTLLFGIIISNIIMTLIFEITYIQQIIDIQINNIPDYSVNLVKVNTKYFLSGTLILILDFVLLAIIFQYLVEKVNKLPFFLTLFISLFSILIFDALIYNLVLFYGSPTFAKSLISHLIGKSISALIFSVILYFYLKYFDKKNTTTPFIENKNQGLFSFIKYRKRYAALKIEKDEIEQKFAFKLETTLDNISDGFINLDTNWRYTYLNKKAADFIGRPASSLIGKHIWKEFPEGVGSTFYNAYYKAAETQKMQYFEEYYEPLDKWFENRVYPTLDGITIYFTDITEKKKADLNNQMLLSLIETSDSFIGLSTLEGKPLYLNSNGKKLIGLEPKDILPQSIKDVFPENYKTTIEKEHIPTIFKTGKWNGEVNFKHSKTKKLIPIEMSGFLIKDASIKKPIALGIVATDITERKKAEDKLIKSEKLFKRLTSKAPAAIFQTDAQGNCNYVNAQWLKYAGLTYEEAMGTGWSKALHPDDEKRIIEEWQEYMLADENELETEFRFLHKDNHVTWVSVKTVGTYDAQNNLYGYIGMALETTERKNAEEKLINSELLFRELTSNAPVGIFKMQIDGTCNYVNEQWVEYADMSFKDAMGFGWAEAIHPEDRNRVLNSWMQVVPSGDEFYAEFRFLNKTGQIKWMSVKAVGNINAKNELYGYIGICLDITQRKEAEEQLKESEKYLENIINNIGDPVFVKDSQSRMVLVNDALCSIFNSTRAEILGKTLAENVPPEERERFLNDDRQIINSGIETVNEETVCLNKIDTITISTKKTRFIDSTGNKFIIGVIRDITERKKSEIKMAEMQRKVESAIRIGKIGYWSWNILKDKVFWSDLIYELYDVDKSTDLKYSTVLSTVHPEDQSFHKRLVKDRITNKSTDSFEYRVLRRDNTIRYVRAQMEVIDDEFGNAIEFQGTVIDITEKKLAELNLIDSEKLFKRLTSSAPVAIFQADTEGACNYVNKEWIKYTGRTFEESMDFGWAEAIIPEDKEKTLKEWLHFVFNKEEEDIEILFRSLHKNGSVSWLSNKAIKTYDANNNFNGIIGMTIDVTNQKKAAEAEINNKKYLNNILNNIGDPIFVKDDQSKLLIANDAFCKIFNLNRLDIIGKNLDKTINPKEQEHFLKIDKQVLSTGIENINEETLTLNGKTPLIFSTKKTRFIDSEGNKLLIGVIRDITEQKQVSEEIRRAHQRLTTHLNNSPVAIIEWDENLIIRNWSSQAENIFGWEVQEVIGKKFKDINLVYKEDARQTIKVCSELIQGVVNSNKSINRNNTKSKKLIYCEWHNSVLRNKDGEIDTIFSLVQDITERTEYEKNLKESEDKLSKIFQSNIIGFSIINSNQVRVDVNETMAKMLETTREHLIGKSFDDAQIEIHDEAYYEQKNRILGKLLKNGYLSNETVHRTLVSGKRLSLLVSVEPLEIAGETHALFAVIDISDKVKVELELENYRSNLEKLVKLRTSELEKEKQKAQSADLMKSAFLATMSHELRTPMNSIIGFTSILLKEFAGPLNNEQKKQLNMVKTSGNHLLGLINDILDISKIEAGKLKVSLYPFNYITTLQKTLDFILPQASKKGLSITSEIREIKLILNSDERRVEQVLLNLLSNAIKFSNKGNIHINVFRKDNFVITQVIDQGIGISKEDLANLFKPFIQIESGLSRSHEGTGLGLAISKNLIEKLGGSISVESTKGKGSNFTFKLPIKLTS